MTTDTPTAQFNPIELTFIGALASDRIDQIDVDVARMRAEAERLGVPLDVENLTLTRAIYGRIVEKVEADLAGGDREAAIRQMADGYVQTVREERDELLADRPLAADEWHGRLS